MKKMFLVFSPGCGVTLIFSVISRAAGNSGKILTNAGNDALLGL